MLTAAGRWRASMLARGCAHIFPTNREVPLPHGRQPIRHRVHRIPDTRARFEACSVRAAKSPHRRCEGRDATSIENHILHLTFQDDDFRFPQALIYRPCFHLSSKQRPGRSAIRSQRHSCAVGLLGPSCLLRCDATSLAHCRHNTV